MRDVILFCVKTGALSYLCLLFSPQTLFAQSHEGDKEIMFSYGVMSGTDASMATIAHGIYEDASYTPLTNSGTIFVTYRQYVRDNVAIGLTIGTQFMSYQYTNTARKFLYQNCTLKTNVTTIAFEYKKIHFHTENTNFQLYSIMGLGMRIFSETATPERDFIALFPVFVNFYYSPLGISIGKNYGFFLELGYGYKGMLNGGLYYRFNSEHN